MSIGNLSGLISLTAGQTHRGNSAAQNLVANRTQYNTTSAAITAPQTSRREHYATTQGDISNLKTVDINKYFSGSTTIVDGPVFDIKRSIEYPEGTFTPVTWNGATTVTLGAGARVVSDAIAITIPAGAKFWERTAVMTSATVGQIALPGTILSLGVSDGVASGDLTTSGTVGAVSSANCTGCQAIIGDCAGASPKSFVLLGDSITWGQLDTKGPGVRGGSGYVARVLDVLGYPWTKWACQGMRAFDAVSLGATLDADLAVMGFTDVVNQYGVNDLTNNLQTAAQIEASDASIYALSNLASKNKWRTTVTPKTTSTDGWATVANQSVYPNFSATELNALNNAIRGGSAGVLEAADAAMSARDSDLWNLAAHTTDGIHPYSNGAAYMAALVAPALDPLGTFNLIGMEEWKVLSGVGAVVTMANGLARVALEGGGTNPRISRYMYYLTVGATYRVRCHVSIGTCASAILAANTTNGLASGGPLYLTINADQDVDTTFVANNSSMYFGLIGVTSTLGQYAEITDIPLVTAV